MARKRKRIILVDADVVSHFIVGGEIYLLPRIFPHKMKILDKVYAELERFRARKVEVDNLLNQKLIELMPFPEDHHEIKREYFRIKRDLFMGDGESACLSVIRFTNDIIGSSNLRDIKRYCQQHELVYLTTMDFLCHALQTGKLDLERCNAFIDKARKAGSKMPVRRMEDFGCRELKF